MISTVKDSIYKRFNGISTGFGANSQFMSDDDARKWMEVAKAIAEVERPCLSRQIGVVIVDPKTNTLVSTGHNGPPTGTARPDDATYLEQVVWPQLTNEERLIACQGDTANNNLRTFVNRYAGCGACPRKIIAAMSGERLELCSCVHGETSAIINAHRSVAGCWMFCWCAVPCVECTKLILQSHISTVFCFDSPPEKDYSPYSSRFLFQTGKTNLVLIDPDWL